mmetsp:Transcript_13563/g.34733  ORF Transcript_13563/g.34733 Transcript_13563/m.34733 type:complete len:271 (+) Transcript_13563:502-1314(+)
MSASDAPPAAGAAAAAPGSGEVDFLGEFLPSLATFLTWSASLATASTSDCLRFLMSPISVISLSSTPLVSALSLFPSSSALNLSSAASCCSSAISAAAVAFSSASSMRSCSAASLAASSPDRAAPSAGSGEDLPLDFLSFLVSSSSLSMRPRSPLRALAPNSTSFFILLTRTSSLSSASWSAFFLRSSASALDASASESIPGAGSGAGALSPTCARLAVAAAILSSTCFSVAKPFSSSALEASTLVSRSLAFSLTLPSTSSAFFPAASAL